MNDLGNWKLCDWDGRAAVWRLAWAMAYLKGRWEDVCSADVGNSAKVMTEAEFRFAYPEVFPLPGHFDAERRKKLH